ncbi:rho guanine nucleotide exchange factor 37-like [Salvelinus namaycush]|uniref:Rho guanine nucleotide exchange factor 37-like n=1 Tax=Salvelinus namaycush TaxID=8040 RepID=A0A8U0UCI1_SALNM|nr:rho guanine nucleotide exchange factor 37-like [Salvelinus namaycush]
MESPVRAEPATPTLAPRNHTPSLSPRAEAKEKRSEESEGTADECEAVDTEEDPICLSLLSKMTVFVEAPAEDASEKAAAEEAAAKERAEREAQRQLLATEELVYTERNYLRLLQVCTCTIRSNLQKLQPQLPNLDSMFLYIEEVIDVSGRLLSLLDQKQVTPHDPLFLETLCDAFLSLSTDIESAYKEYLSNYSNVTALENSYKQKEPLWTEMVKVIKSSAPEVNATSLSFFLVMPVQRIARYPLLLQTIMKHTDPGHPAYSLLEQTAHAAVAINCRINEYKRFREVADKYKKTETLTIRDKINRLNSHSIAKKTARLSQFIKHETGIAPKLVDEEFDALEGFFYLLENGIAVLHENVETYLSHLQEKRIRTLVHKPLCALRELLAGPRNLIRKRLDKLLDYELIEEKPSLSYDEQAVANTYKTINTLLLNELPQFNGLALTLLWGMLGAFSCLHKDLAADMEQLFQGFAQQLPHSSLEPNAFWEWAECSVLEGARMLESLCRNVEDQLNAPIVQPLSPGSQKCLKVLTDKHGSGKIYQLTGHVVGTRDLDLSLNRGELVAIISEMDTRGDRRRWLVDAGGPRGYVPSSKLVRYHQVTMAPPPSPHLTVTTMDCAGGVRRHSYTPDIRRHSFSPDTPQPVRTLSMTMPCLQVFAGYDFTARSSHEVSLRAGEPIRVLEPHDKRGSRDWSLVEVREQRGYVPSNYLAAVPTSMSPTTPYH